MAKNCTLASLILDKKKINKIAIKWFLVDNLEQPIDLWSKLHLK